MSQDPTEYLAIHVLNEQQLISYRSLSRALKVHCNLAKEFLADFYRRENEKRKGSVYATYIVSGVKKAHLESNGTHNGHDDDTIMQSSPLLPGSSMPLSDDHRQNQVETRSIVLVREEQLEIVKRDFDSISGVHIYSLSAAGISNLEALTECNRRVAIDYGKENPLRDRAQYGSIQNPQARRRERPHGQPAPAPPATDPVVKLEPVAPTRNPPQTTTSTVRTTTAVAAKATPAEGDKKKIGGTATLKRESSDIFKSFAKARAAPVKQESKASASKAAEVKEEPMVDFSDEDINDDDDGMLDAEAAALEPAGKTKQEREAELQAMMEQEDDPMDDAPPSPVQDDAQELSETIQHVTKEEPGETVVVENGRRRGRRRVMKKKTVKDEDGYLVTREEAAWESFSEDEPAPKKAKVQPAPVENAQASKKSSAKPGQGNIMSFFAKK